MEKYFRRLGLPPTATKTEVTAAWRSLAQKAHPDKHGGNTDEYVEINNAYNALLRHFEAEDNKDIFDDIFRGIAAKKREGAR